MLQGQRNKVIDLIRDDNVSHIVQGIELADVLGFLDPTDPNNDRLIKNAQYAVYKGLRSALGDQDKDTWNKLVELNKEYGIVDKRYANTWKGRTRIGIDLAKSLLKQANLTHNKPSFGSGGYIYSKDQYYSPSDNLKRKVAQFERLLDQWEGFVYRFVFDEQEHKFGILNLDIDYGLIGIK